MLYFQALSATQKYLADFAATNDFEDSIVNIFGAGIDRSQLQIIQQQLLAGDFSLVPELRVVENGELGTANGAYASELDQVLIAGDFLRQADLLAVADWLLEEVGHKLDRLLNGVVDSPGDEGAIFRLVVTGQEVSAEILTGLRSVDDHGVVVLDGELIAIEKQDFVGTAANDTIAGTSGDDRISGLGGNDDLSGLAGNDTLLGGDGDDYLDPGTGVDQIDGGAGNDALVLNLSAATTDLAVNYTTATNGAVTGGTTFQNIESLNLRTGSGNNVITATATTGNAIIRGGAGNDSIQSGSGRDRIEGGDGDDIIRGGAGNDDGGYVVFPAENNYTGLFGGNGNDLIDGEAGNDALYGEAGNDTLIGANTSVMNPGLGETDYFSGGAGSDRFILGDEANIYYDDRKLTIAGTNDYATISDFNPNEDKVQL
jgi:Ca2+-binding RTX toxin-like protein